jgi:hypothetical protein
MSLNKALFFALVIAIMLSAFVCRERQCAGSGSHLALQC